jgi:hypothetical protein
MIAFLLLDSTVLGDLRRLDPHPSLSRRTRSMRNTRALDPVE